MMEVVFALLVSSSVLTGETRELERLPVGACELRASIVDFYTSDFIVWCDEVNKIKEVSDE